MKTLIVDDELDACLNLTGILSEHCPEIEVMGMAHSVQEALAFISNHQPDLVFLDVQMPAGSGFGLMEHFNQAPFQVIFVTAFHEYAIQAIKVSALDYILKPIDVEGLKRAVARTHERKLNNVIVRRNTKSQEELEEHEVLLKSNQSQLVIHQQELLFIESMGRTVNIHLIVDRQLESHQSISAYAEIFKGKNFMQVHRNFLVNLNHVREFRAIPKEGGPGSTLVMKNGSEIPVESSLKKEVIQGLEGL